MADTVPAAEFARNFGRYKLLAQREAVPVSSNGTLADISSRHTSMRSCRSSKAMRRRFLTAELSDAEAEAIASSRMDPRHDHLNRLLDPDNSGDRMAIPTPEPGLVISYAYLWDHEAQSGQEEGRKDRPCVIALAVERQQDGETLVTVLPVTHRPPDDAAAAVEIPLAVKTASWPR